MSHLIDADALIDEIKKDTEKVIKQDDRVGSFWLGYIAGLVIKQPTIQPEPKEGHWKKDETDDCPPVFRQFRICSVCGAIETSETNYCPNCGAKMKGAQNG